MEFNKRLVTVSLFLFIALIAALAGWYHLTDSSFAAATDDANAATFMFQQESDQTNHEVDRPAGAATWADPGLADGAGLANQGDRGHNDVLPKRSGPFAWTGFTWAGYSWAG